MKNVIKYGLLILTIPTLTFLQSCEDGPMEEAGENIDRAADDVGDAARDAGNRVEDACEDLTNSNC